MAVSARASGQVNVQRLWNVWAAAATTPQQVHSSKIPHREEADRMITEAIEGYFADQETEDAEEK